MDINLLPIALVTKKPECGEDLRFVAGLAWATVAWTLHYVLYLNDKIWIEIKKQDLILPKITNHLEALRVYIQSSRTDVENLSIESLLQELDSELQREEKVLENEEIKKIKIFYNVKEEVEKIRSIDLKDDSSIDINMIWDIIHLADSCMYVLAELELLEHPIV